MRIVARNTFCATLLHLATLLRVGVRVLMRVLLVWLLAFLRSELRMLAVVATHIVHLRKVDIHITARHYPNVTNYRVVVWVLVVELVALVAHKASHVEHLVIDLSTVLFCLGDVAHEVLCVLAIVLVHHTTLGIWQLFRLYLKILA